MDMLDYTQKINDHFERNSETYAKIIGYGSLAALSVSTAIYVGDILGIW